MKFSPTINGWYWGQLLPAAIARGIGRNAPGAENEGSEADASFDRIGSASHKRLRYRKSEGSGRLQVQDELNNSRALYG